MPYFPEKEQDHEESLGGRLSESITMKALTVNEPAQDESHPEGSVQDGNLDESVMPRGSLIAIALQSQG